MATKPVNRPSDHAGRGPPEANRVSASGNHGYCLFLPSLPVPIERLPLSIERLHFHFPSRGELP